MLRAIIRHVMRFLRALSAAPGNILRGLVGGGAPIAPSAEFEEVVDEQVEELREELNARPETPLAVRTLGELVHAYASGDTAAKESFDLGRIPDHVSLALLSMKSGDLAKLASASPDQCGRWALGQRSGIVGVAAPSKDQGPAVTGRLRDEGEQASALLPAGERRAAVKLRLAA